MKSKYIYIIGVVLAALAFAACSDDDEKAGSLDSIALDKTYLTIPMTGGDVNLTIKAGTEWAFDKVVKVGTHKDDAGKTVPDYDCLPTWLTASALSGGAGETTITFHADEATSGREVELCILAGKDKQFVIVRQGSLDASSATCAEVLAGSDGKTYRVKGTCTAIANTTYGNWYLNDGTGEVYIYGTLDAKGAEKNFTSLGIELGDEITVEGPRSTYNGTVELVNVTVLKITKSLIKVVSENPTVGKDGGEFVIKAAYKGNGALVNIPEEYDWINIVKMDYVAGVPTKIEANPCDTAIITFKVDANTAGARTGVITIGSANSQSSSSVNVTVSQEGSIREISCADFNAQPDGSALYKVTGIITKVANSKYGNIYIRDASGEIYVYGTLNADGESQKFTEMGLKVGDVVTLVGPKSSYKDSPQMVNGVYQSHIAVKALSLEDFKDQDDDNNTFYLISGKICEPTEEEKANNMKWDITTYGNFVLEDEEGTRLYIYGVYIGWGTTDKKQFGKIGEVHYGDEAKNVKEGDNITMIAYKTSYKGFIEGIGYYMSHETPE